MENDFYLIERFFQGSLNPDEITEFEKRRQNDKKFDEDVRLFSQASDVIREAARQRMKERLDNLGKQHQSITMVESYLKYRMTARKWIAMAAMVTLIAVVSFALFTRQHGSPASIYSLNYTKPGTGLLATRSGESNAIETAWQTALENYEQNNYDGAKDKILTLLSDTAFSHISAAHFVAGICYLNLENPDSAVLHLQHVSAGSSFSEDAQWYLGLTYLRAGNTDKAAGIFKELKSSGSEKFRKASRKILRMMKRAKTE